jgi:hypothetical protein
MKRSPNRHGPSTYAKDSLICIGGSSSAFRYQRILAILKASVILMAADEHPMTIDTRPHPAYLSAPMNFSRNRR